MISGIPKGRCDGGGINKTQMRKLRNANSQCAQIRKCKMRKIESLKMYKVGKQNSQASDKLETIPNAYQQLSFFVNTASRSW